MRLEVALRRRVSAAFTLDVAFDVDLHGEPHGHGPVAALFGPSGSGKTTTLWAIAGLAEIDEGRVVLGGETLVDTSAGTCLPPERRAVGLVAQDGLLFPHLDVAGNLAYGERRAGSRPRQERARVLDVLRLGGLLGHGVASLSGGERQRVAIARALLAGPRLLLLDEPVSALDEASRFEALALIDDVAHAFGVPVLFVSHARTEVLRLAAWAARIEGGRIVETGPAERVLAATAEPGPVPNVLRATFEAAASPGTARLPGGALVQLPAEGAPGADVWFQVASGAITLEPPGREPAVTSARNRLPGRVVALWRGPLRVRVAVDVGAAVVVDVTPESAARFDLAPGRDVVCVFKTHSAQMLR